MLDARVGEQPLQVPLNQDERHRDEYRQEAERQKQASGEFGPGRRRRDHVDAQDAVHRAVEHAHGHQDHCRRRRFAVRVGLPRVHWGQAGLRAVADEREHHAQAQRERMHLGRRRHQPRPIERRHAFAQVTLPCGEQQHGAEQREPEAQAAQHEELPRRLEGGVPVVK
jgi:hypothetical protein